MRNWINALRESFIRFFTRPEEEVGRWGRAVRLFLRFSRRAAEALMRDRAPQMAAALAYRTIFSIVPIFIVGLVTLRGLYGSEAIKAPLKRFLEYLGLTTIAIQQEGPPEEGATSVATGPSSVADWIESIVLRLEQLNFAAIGAVGGVILIYAAISLLIEVERSFNVVYGAAMGRRTLGRLVNYWALLTLGPIGLISSYYVGLRFNAAVEGFAATWIAQGMASIVQFSISWLLLAIAFLLIPNTRVHKTKALGAAFVAAVLWEAGKAGFRQYLAYSTRFADIYGSLGLIPIFLLWIYITWLVILFGLELSFVWQTMSIKDGERVKDQSGSDLDPLAAVALIATVARRFREGRSTSPDLLADEQRLSEITVRRVAERLMDAKILVAAHDEDEEIVYSLARPAETIGVADVLRACRPNLPIVANGEKATGVERLVAAQLDAAQRMTVATLIEPEEDESARRTK